MAEGVLFSPGLISSGSFTLTQFSITAQADATAIAALSSISNPAITKRQIRFGSGGPIYNISAYNTGTGALTLDRIYRESSGSGTSYQLYRCYYGTPEDGAGTEVTDFERYNSIYNPTISSYFVGINMPRDLLNKRDPKSSATSNNPYYMFSYKSDSNNQPLWEMWPHPTSSKAYICSYQKRGDLLADSDVLPPTVPDQLVLERAYYYGCDWAFKNSSRLPELKGINWLLQKAVHQKTYSNISNREPGLLEIAHRQDEELFPQNIVVMDRTYNNYVIGDDLRQGFFSIDPG